MVNGPNVNDPSIRIICSFINHLCRKDWMRKIHTCHCSGIRGHHISHSVDTRFFTHDLIMENDWNDHPCTPKIKIALHASICLCITCINSFIAYHKNDLEILTVVMVLSVFKLDCWIERNCMIKLHGQHALCLGVWFTSNTFWTGISFCFNEKLLHHPLMKSKVKIKTHYHLP